LRIKTVDINSRRGVPDVFFWIAPVDRPRNWQLLRSSTSSGVCSPQTDRNGELHVVLDVSRGTKYVVKVGGIRGRDVEEPQGWIAPRRLGGIYQAVKVESDPIELPVGETQSLQVELR
jgi:hypothetical protein